MPEGPVHPVSPATPVPFAPQSGNGSGVNGLAERDRIWGGKHLAGLGLSQGRGLAMGLGVLGLFATLFLAYRIFSRPGPLLWSSQPTVRFAAGQPAAFRIKTEKSPAPEKYPQKAPQRESNGKSPKGFRPPAGPDLSGKINPNTASHEELCELPGIGKVIASRIIATRAEKPFGRAEDLRRVQGIGAKTLERIRPQMIFETDKPADDQSQFPDGTNP